MLACSLLSRPLIHIEQVNPKSFPDTPVVLRTSTDNITMEDGEFPPLDDETADGKPLASTSVDTAVAIADENKPAEKVDMTVHHYRRAMLDEDGKFIGYDNDLWPKVTAKKCEQ